MDTFSVQCFILYGSYSTKLSSLSLLISYVFTGTITYFAYFLTLGKSLIDSLLMLKDMTESEEKN